MIEIHLPCERVTLISDVDGPRIRQHKWHACTKNASGKPYVRTTIAGKTIYLHRMIIGCPPAYRGDHRDNNTLNNQRPNLRVATHDQNNFNRCGWGASGYKGVSRDGRRFRVRIVIEGVEKLLGRFDTAEQGALAYDEAAHDLFGEFAWLNFPENYPQPNHNIPELSIPFF